jgi:integrase
LSVDATSTNKTRDVSPPAAQPQHKRKRIAKGIYLDRGAIAAVVKVGSGEHARQKERRYERGTSLREIKEWQRVTAAKLRKGLKRRAARGTFDADIAEYLDTLKDKPALQALRKKHLEWWADQRDKDHKRFGSRVRASFESPELRATLAHLAVTPMLMWKSQPPRIPSAATVRHYRTALYSLFTSLDGKNEPNPLRDVKPSKSEDPEPRALPEDLVEMILAAMPDRGQGVRGKERSEQSMTKARLRVEWRVGIPPRQIMQLKPEDVNWDEPSVFVKGRKKGGGARAVRLPLTDAGVQSLREFFTVGATGEYSTSSVRASWWRGIHRVVDRMAATDWRTAKQLLDTLTTMKARPYDLRHTFLTQTYLIGKDLRGTQAFAQHADIRTTQRYTLGAVDARLRAITGQINAARLAVPANVPAI